MHKDAISSFRQRSARSAIMKPSPLTEKDIQKLVVPAGAREAFLFDPSLPGFFLRKFSSGRASFGVKYSVAGRQRRMALGPALPGTLATMRRRAADVLAKARVGQDIVGEKRAAVARAKAEQERQTLGETVRLYLEARKNELRPRSFIEVRRHLERDWQPLHDRNLDTIARSDVNERLDVLARSNGKVAADRARASLSALFTWAIDRGLVATTPLLHIRARAKNGSRERVLSEAELIEVWRACEDDDHGRIVRLLILTGQRRAEIGDLRWSEVDLGARQIELPRTRTKNHRAHVVPLSDAALDVLGARERREGRDFVFGRSSGGFSGWSKCKARLDERIAERRRAAGNASGMPPWTLHDLRRTAVTHMAQNKIAQPHILEAIINHASGHKAGVAGVYNLASYPEEKREALQAWGARLAAVV